MKPEIILVGGGGHCKSCIDVIEQQDIYQIAGIVDAPTRLHEKVMGYEIIGTDEDLPALAKERTHFHVTLGQIKSPQKRIGIYERLAALGVSMPAIVSPLAYVSRHARVGNGTIIMHHAVINAAVRIGDNCIINSKALVEHDVVVGDHCHISTAAVINGGCAIGNGVFVGCNAVCREMITVGDHTVVGCGLRVMKDV